MSRTLAACFKSFELLEHLTVVISLSWVCRVSSQFGVTQAHRERAAQLAREVGIDDKLGRYARKLSQGERLRVAICRALLLEPQLLLCDELTGNLDLANNEHALDIHFGYVQRTGTTLLAVTHDHGLLDRFDESVDVGH